MVLLGLFCLLFVRPGSLRLSKNRAAVVALVAILGLNLAALYMTTQKVTVQMTKDQYSAAPTLKELGVKPGDVIAEGWFVVWWVPNNHMREVYWTTLIRFDADNSKAPPEEANVVVAPWKDPKREDSNWDGSRYGFHLIGEYELNHWAAWRKN